MCKDTKITRLTPDIIGTELDKDLNPDRFPVETLPEPCRYLVNEANEALNLDPAFTGAACLAALSTVIGNSYRLKLKAGRTYPANLFIGIIGSPGSGKTPASNIVFEPLKQINNEKYREYLKELEAFEHWENLPKEEKGNSEKPKKPVWKRRLLDDHTPETLPDVLNDNPKGVCLFVDELASWYQSFQRYNAGPDMERWLSIWSGQPFSVTRVSKPPKNVPSPFCSVFGGIQPGVLPSLLDNSKLVNGFADRILFAFESLDKQPDRWDSGEVSEWTIANYKERIETLDSLQPGFVDGVNPKMLNLTSKTMDIWKDYYNEIQQRIHSAPDYEASILSKIEQYVPRLTLILALGNNPETPQAKPGDMENAIRLSKYFEHTAMKARELAGAGGNLDKVNVIKYLRSLGASQNEIANAMKCSQQYVQKVLKK